MPRFDFGSGDRVSREADLTRGVAWRPGERAMTEAISAAIVALYSSAYGHHRTTATTYINDRVVVCVLESILTTQEDALIAAGSDRDVIDGRVGFQTDTEDEFTAAIEGLTGCRVTAFLSANQTTPGVACELFFLDANPLRDRDKGEVTASWR
jgi:uncharacterized protein YbcI